MTVRTEDTEDLDAAIAVAVMGWSSRTIPWAYSDEVAVWHDAEELPVMTCHAWRPHADDGQCQAVLDRLLQLGFECSIRLTDSSATVDLQRAGHTWSASDPDRRTACLRASLEAVAGRPE